MFTHYTKIYLKDTDATGVIFFTQELRIALEAFEAYLASREINLTDMLQGGDFYFPIVHAEADFTAPIRAGDEIAVHLFSSRIGNSSFTLNTHLFNQNKIQVGKTTIVHVCTAKSTWSSVPIPDVMLSLLHEIMT